MYRNTVFCVGLLLAGTPAVAQSGTTVNDYSVADRVRAEKAARAAGFAPVAVAMAQAGHLFLNAEKDGQTHVLTHRRDHRAHLWPPPSRFFERGQQGARTYRRLTG